MQKVIGEDILLQELLENIYLKTLEDFYKASELFLHYCK